MVQNRPSKRRRLNPDPTSPKLRFVTASLVLPTNKFLAVKRHVRKQQEEGARLPPPPANSLEGLPHELQLVIFNFLPDVDTFDALVNASPVHRRIFAYCPDVRDRFRFSIREREAGYELRMICKELGSLLEKFKVQRPNLGF